MVWPDNYENLEIHLLNSERGNFLILMFNFCRVQIRMAINRSGDSKNFCHYSCFSLQSLEESVAI